VGEGEAVIIIIIIIVPPPPVSLGDWPRGGASAGGAGPDRDPNPNQDLGPQRIIGKVGGAVIIIPPPPFGLGDWAGGGAAASAVAGAVAVPLSSTVPMPCPQCGFATVSATVGAVAVVAVAGANKVSVGGAGPDA
jgi:hypothetical protein